MSVLIWVQTVCKGYQQTTKFTRVNLDNIEQYMVFKLINYSVNCLFQNRDENMATGPEVIKLFSCNSTEHKIYDAHKC